MQKINTYTKNSIELINKLYSGGFLHLLSANYVLKLIGFSSQIFVAWILVKEDIGRIGVLQNFFRIFIVLACFGFPQSIVKFCSEDISKEKSYSLYYYGNKFTLISVAISYCISLILSFFGVFSPDPIINYFVPLYFLSLLPIALNKNTLAYLQAQQKIKLFANVQLLTGFINIILILSLTYFFHLKGYFIALVSGNFLTFLFLEYYKKRIKQPVERGKYLKKHLTYSIPSLLANFIGSISNNFDLLLLNYILINRELLGSYSFAVILIGALTTISQSTQQYIIPRFSKMGNDFNVVLSKLKEYQKKWIKYAILIVVTINIVFIPFLIFFSNGKYKESILPFFILTIAWFFNSFLSIQGALFFGSGFVKINLFNSIIYLALVASLCYLGYIVMGITGVPIGVLISNILILIIIQYELKKIKNTL